MELPEKLNAVTLKGRSAEDYNDFGDERTTLQEMILHSLNGKITNPAHSVTFIGMDFPKK